MHGSDIKLGIGSRDLLIINLKTERLIFTEIKFNKATTDIRMDEI